MNLWLLYCVILFQGLFVLVAPQVYVEDATSDLLYGGEGLRRSFGFDDWFGGSNREDSSNTKFFTLYKIVECLSTNNPRNCQSLVQNARKNFDKSKPRPVTPNNAQPQRPIPNNQNKTPTSRPVTQVPLADAISNQPQTTQAPQITLAPQTNFTSISSRQPQTQVPTTQPQPTS